MKAGEFCGPLIFAKSDDLYLVDLPIYLDVFLRDCGGEKYIICLCPFIVIRLIGSSPCSEDKGDSRDTEHGSANWNNKVKVI